MKLYIKVQIFVIHFISPAALQYPPILSDRLQSRYPDPVYLYCNDQLKIMPMPVIVGAGAEHILVFLV